MRITARQVKNVLEQTAYYVRTWSPGDGVTRYRFFEKRKPSPSFKTGEASSYFGPDNSIFTALGSREAWTFAMGLSR